MRRDSQPIELLLEDRDPYNIVDKKDSRETWYLRTGDNINNYNNYNIQKHFHMGCVRNTQVAHYVHTHPLTLVGYLRGWVCT
jgi:hypothetical protein